MKNIIKKIGVFALCFTVCCGAFACKNKGESSSVDSSVEEQEKELVETGYKIVTHGVSEYQIVLPDKQNAMYDFAASELNYFLGLATGADLSIVKESVAKADLPAICIGESSFTDRLGVTLTATDLGTSGYTMKNVDDSLVILCSNTEGEGEGCLYGVYDFLEDAIGFKSYSVDELYYEEKENVPLYEYDEVVYPDFDQREIGYALLANDSTYQKRMRLIWHDDSKYWGISGHNQAADGWGILPQSIYRDQHQDWYNGEGTQLCWTAGDEMETEFAKNLYAQILKYPDAMYFHFGQQDNENFCNCTRCAQAKIDYAGNVEGLQVVFANHVIEKVEAMMAADGVNRNIRYMIYAYNGTIQSPVVKNADGTFSPYSQQVIPHEKLYIWFAPIGTDFSKPLEHENNKTYYDSMQGWNVLCPGRVIAYLYDINFYNYFVNFNNFGTVKPMYEAYRNLGVYYMYTQGPVDAVVPSLQEMRIFVESQLMWDLDQDYDDLVKEFMEHYFREGADAMYMYYTLLRNRYTYYQSEINDNIGGIYAAIGGSDLWTEPVVSALGDCIDNALKAIEPLKETDAELYEKVKNRIMKENLSVIFLKLSHYQSYYSNEENAQMKADFKYYTQYFGIMKHVEGGSIDGMFD